jgi:hypothetical protein
MITLLVALLVLSPLEINQSEPNRVGAIEFFGCSGINLDKLRASLKFREGDEFTNESAKDKLNQITESVKRAIGHPPTDISPSCCDPQNRFMFYIGLSGKAIQYKKLPNGNIRLPMDAFHVYEEFMKAWEEGIIKGIPGEDQTKGYALSDYTPTRAFQLKMRSFALSHESLIKNVLANSADDQHRIAAAQLLGYARQSAQQIKALVEAATTDANDTVRNNAIRALWVLANSNPNLANHIPPAPIAELLLSGFWTDLNKGSLLLDAMTRDRNKNILETLRQPEIIDRLIEMAGWKTGHAQAARSILGRIGGIEEKKLQQLVRNTESLKEITSRLPGRQ